MQKDADVFETRLNRSFVVEALHAGARIDGRSPFDARETALSFSPDDSSVTVSIGQTRALAVVRADLEAPRSESTNEGRLLFNIDFSPMASTAFEQGRMGRDATQIANLLDRSLKDSQAVDLEALNVLTGRKIWTIRVDVRILDHDGNLTDIALLAAIAALSGFRLPQVEVSSSGDVTVYSPAEREPHALTIQHIPLAATFAIFENGHTLVLDPTLQEECSSTGSVTIISNAHDELCGVHKARGTGLESGQLMRCVRLANRQAKDVHTILRAALEAHKSERVRVRVKRRAAAMSLAAQTGAPPSAQVLPAVATATLQPGGAEEVALEHLPAMSDLNFDEPMRPASQQEASSCKSAAEAQDSVSNDRHTEDQPSSAPETEGHQRARLSGQEGIRKKKRRPKPVVEHAREVKRAGIPDKAIDKEPGFDNFGEIAAMIAGATPGERHVNATIAASIKVKKKGK